MISLNYIPYNYYISHQLIMNKLIIPFVFVFCMVMASCSNDDDSQFELSGTYLEATTWDAELTGETYPDHNPISAHFIMQFLTNETGKCIPTYDDSDYEGSFTYSITKDMILFNGSLTGYWTVIDHTKTQIVLQSFQPYEFKLVLTKK